MRILRQLLKKEGWHFAETGLPVQVGVKVGGYTVRRKSICIKPWPSISCCWRATCGSR